MLPFCCSVSQWQSHVAPRLRGRENVEGGSPWSRTTLEVLLYTERRRGTAGTACTAWNKWVVSHFHISLTTSSHIWLHPLIYFLPFSLHYTLINRELLCAEFEGINYTMVFIYLVWIGSRMLHLFYLRVRLHWSHLMPLFTSGMIYSYSTHAWKLLSV